MKRLPLLVAAAVFTLSPALSAAQTKPTDQPRPATEKPRSTTDKPKSTTEKPKSTTEKPRSTNEKATSTPTEKPKPIAERPSPNSDGNFFKESWITTKTKMALMTDKRVRARYVTVDTHGGIVTLRGKVSSVAEKSAAEEIARDVGGVRGVSSLLQVVPEGQRKAVDAKDAEIESAVKARLVNDDTLRGASIVVRADNAIVTLMGKVRDARGLARAGDLARAIRGVKAVRNELRQQI